MGALRVDSHALDRFIERAKTEFNSREHALDVLRCALKGGNKKDGRHKFVCEGRLWTYAVKGRVVVTVFKDDKLPAIDKQALRDGRRVTPFIRMK